MKHRTQLLAIAGLIAISSGAPTGSLKASQLQAPVPLEKAAQHQVVGGNLGERLEVYLGLALFERAGLDLPPVRIYVHDDDAGCNGHPGLFNKDGSGNRVDLCADLIRHELGHVWTYHNLTDADRDRFVDHANLTTWGDHAAPHRRRGIEQAANVISWGVGLQRLEAGEVDLYEEFLLRYKMLTGKDSPRIAHLVQKSPPSA